MIDYGRMKFEALRVKLIILSFVTIAISLLLLSPMVCCGNIGVELMETAGWELVAILIGVAACGLVLLVYVLRFMKYPESFAPPEQGDPSESPEPPESTQS